MAREKLQVILELVANQFKSEVRGASQSLGGFRRNLDSSSKSTSTLEQGMSKVGRVAKLAIAGAAIGAVAGMTRELAMSVRAFADFDQKMTQSLAIMGDVSARMRGEMSDAAREVGRTTLFSASQAAEAYFFLASAGFDAAQSVAAMPQVAKFAQAGMFDMALATDLATDAQSALGLKSANTRKNLENLTRVTDVFVKANTLANTSVQQISEAMTTKAGAALRSLGKDIEEGSAVLAAFADQGVKGAEAGTQFAIVLRDLQSKALANVEAFRDAEVAVFDASGEMRNIADIIGDLENALVGMSDAEKKTTLLGLGFSDKSVSAITALLGTSDAIRTYEASLRSAAGFTEDVADKQLKSLSGQFELLKSAVNDTRIAVGEEMAPAFEELIPQLQTAVAALGEFGIAMGSDLATAVGLGIGFLEGAQEAVFDFKAALLTNLGNVPVVGIGFNMLGADDAANVARQQAALVELLGRIRRQGLTEKDRHAPTEFANSLVHLERQALLTEDSMESLARTFGLSTEETLMGLEAYEEWMAIHKQDIPTDQLERWQLELHASLMAAEELERFRSRWPEIFGAAGASAAANAPPVGEFGGEVEKTADEAERLAEALMLAAAAQESLADQILRFTNPVFNAISAIEGLRSAEEKVEELRKDRKTTDEELAAAELEITRKTLQAKSAMDALGEESDAIEGLALAFDGPRERLIEILETLGLIEDGKWSTILDVQLRIDEEKFRRDLAGLLRTDTELSDTLGGRQYPTDPLEAIEGAQHQGGMVEAGKRYPVLRNEIFIPSQNGMVAPMGSGVTNNYVNVVVPLKDMSQFAAESARAIEQVLDRREKAVA
jgi:TP901 family phage tail tape measure protein